MNEDKPMDIKGYNHYKRVRYFHGMLLTDRDFTEQDMYQREKRKLHNRMLHGWGVVCGLGIKAANHVSSKVVITQGLALDCHGNEIFVVENFEVDLSKIKPKGTTAQSKPENCNDPGTENQDCKYYIAIQYLEDPSDSVPVYTSGSGCEEKTCDCSRTREGFCVKLFKEIPCQSTILDQNFDFCKDPVPYIPCCCNGDPWVVLGSVTISTNQTLTVGQEQINFEGRHYVITPMLCAALLKNNYNTDQLTKLLKGEGEISGLCSPN